MIRAALHRPILNLVALLIFDIFLLSIQMRTPSGQSLLRGWTMAVVSPTISASSYLSHRASTMWDDYVGLVGVRKQNRRLQQENHQLRMELQRLQQLDQLHARMEGYQQFQLQFQYGTVAARIISKSPPFWKSTLLLNVGGNDAVRADGSVITPLGIVGRVVTVAPGTSEVELITNVGASAGVFVGEGRIQGITQGNGDDTISLRYISNQEQVRSGDLVVTSGTDRIYPPGLPVGRVLAAQNSTQQIFKDVTVKPAVNLANLQEVLVLTGYRYKP
ncbi:MAG: rod shape-determining protein MreC [Acidobacteria bacterium]|nr:rod shape-determining protein MreC [Acidobacteriota bacterium]